MPTLRGVNCEPIWTASGAQGFFGEGYPYHRLLKLFFPWGFSFKGSTFVAKTTTLMPRQGNLPLKRDGITPREWLPKCVVVKPLQKVALNAVGLSGPGALALFETKRWQEYRRPFFVSFMSVEKDPDARLKELEEFLELFRRYHPAFKAPVGLQVNFSCPNVGLHPGKLVGEVRKALDLADAKVSLRVPVVPKFNALLPISAAKEIASHRRCDALCVSNTIPWGALPHRIDWQDLFGSSESPLKKYGGGDLSGAPLLSIVRDWVTEARAAGITKHINAGGGILCADDVRTLFRAGASSVFVGSAVMLCPWRLQSIIRTAHLAAPN
ncbi:hypothetical protein A3A38_01290 [Candidatus Kaiserbacteria bacterium RIFCSPLOWO2_01_FULL_53_17]|uniref:Dihydroorotate dehydrogenase catalytic domain-containing protein n=1 Tax=Candidatus Kaiserbacteria bacterium RIFCSPLOWO2_01_FULL_53_17 TaxID=1798511 RepID=A0A1F6EGU1_9BACT|nr:MAG: hypothetical protein A3A38_01290 [Candidatus Kaiserbacteria bacterium RIFCSPLOWO2_01_FULL_53_17]